jgi:hypothetical protein
LNVRTAAGINTKSPNNAMTQAEEIKTPSENTWLKEEKNNPEADKKRTAVVETSAREVLWYAVFKQS